MTLGYAEVVRAGQEILDSLRAGDAGSMALQDKMQRRLSMFQELAWGDLANCELDSLSEQDHQIMEAAARLESTLIKALSARFARKKMSNPRAYGRFQDMRA